MPSAQLACGLTVTSGRAAAAGPPGACGREAGVDAPLHARSAQAVRRQGVIADERREELQPGWGEEDLRGNLLSGRYDFADPVWLQDSRNRVATVSNRAAMR